MSDVAHYDVPYGHKGEVPRFLGHAQTSSSLLAAEDPNQVAPADRFNATSDDQAVTPDAPTALGATAISATQIDLTWTDQSEGMEEEVSFVIQRSPAGAGTWAEVGTNPADDTTFSDTGLTASTAYDYRVAARNAAGTSAWSATASATTTA